VGGKVTEDAIRSIFDLRDVVIYNGYLVR
ncbi:MAG: hypothetical protein JWR61_5790, partial [Ferruginibacter sp.]|nr:hypothetical protein [Ferruginibacter sp.]